MNFIIENSRQILTFSISFFAALGFVLTLWDMRIRMKEIQESQDELKAMIAKEDVRKEESIYG